MITAINPSIIKWARKRMGYSVDDIATKMNISSSRVQEWENGEIGISYTNLEVLAYRYFKIPIAVFFFPNPPNIEAPKSKFRRFPDYEIERLSPDTLDKIRIAQAYQNSLVELLQNNKPNKQIWVDIQSNSTNLVSLSESVRKYIGISIEQQYSFNSNNEALKAWRHSLEKCGVFTFKDSFKDKYMSGFCLIHNDFPIIMINNSNSFSRQLFTLIHELGHILLSVNGLTDVDNSYMNYMEDDGREIEIVCNRFTSELLVPSSNFREDIKLLDDIDEKSISNIAKKYCVSREVILRKLLDSRVINQLFYNKFATKWNKDYMRRKPDKDGGNWYLTRLSYLGKGFSRIAFDSYRRGNISKAQLSENLRVRAVNLNNLETHLNK